MSNYDLLENEFLSVVSCPLNTNTHERIKQLFRESISRKIRTPSKMSINPIPKEKEEIC